MKAFDISQTPLVRRYGVHGAKFFLRLWFPLLYAFLIIFTAALPVAGAEIAGGWRRFFFGCLAGGLVVLATSLLTRMQLEYLTAIERLGDRGAEVGSDLLRQGGTSPLVRITAGILSALMLLVGLPASVYVASNGEWQAWLIAFCSLFAGIGFAGVVWTGHWFRFRRSDDTRNVMPSH